MAYSQTASDEIEEGWKIVVDKVIACVLNNRPNDQVLASYLGKDVENNYQVHHLNLKNQKHKCSSLTLL